MSSLLNAFVNQQNAIDNTVFSGPIPPPDDLIITGNSDFHPEKESILINQNFEEQNENTENTEDQEENEEEKTKAGSSPIVWVEDSAVTACEQCKKPFSVMIRRHHCRACGKIFCAKCSSLEALLPPHYNYQNGMERVCDVCSFSYWPYHSDIAKTDIGDIEYCKIGDGEKFVVAIHGSFGDFTQSLATTYYLTDKPEEYTILSYSRPGYGRTPSDLTIPTTTYEGQAQLIYYLLRYLLVTTKVHLIAYSTGGPVALQFAMQYPVFVSSMTLISCITYKYWAGQAKGVTEEESKMASLPAANASLSKKISNSFQVIGTWFAKKLAVNFPFGTKVMLKNILSEGSLFDPENVERHIERIITDPTLVWIFQSQCLSFQNSPGFVTDMTMAKSIDGWNLHDIKVPTLVIHGRNDGDISITHAEYVVSQLANAKLLSLNDSEHMVWLSSFRPLIENYVEEFISDPPGFIGVDSINQHYGDVFLGRVDESPISLFNAHNEDLNHDSRVSDNINANHDDGEIKVVEDMDSNISEVIIMKNENEDVQTIEELSSSLKNENSVLGAKIHQKKLQKVAKEHQTLADSMFNL